MSECGEASAVSVEGDRFAIVIVVQKGFWCGGPLALLAGSGNTSTPSTGLFQDHTPTLAMIAQLQLPSSTGSLVEHENSRTTFVSFQVHSTVLRQVHRSEPHEPQEQSGHPQWFLRSPRSSLRS